MKKLLFKKQKLNNSGMTLVEIMVAIGILSVAIIPLLFAFVNVTRYNAEARELQQATVLAQTVVENCKAYSLEEIDKQITGPAFTFMKNVSGHDKVVAGEDVNYYMTGVKIENQMYDVALNIKPYETFNSGKQKYEMIETQSMNAYKDAIFTVKTPNIDNYTAELLDVFAYDKALEKISAGIKQEAAKIDEITEEINLSSAEVLLLDDVKQYFKMNRDIKILLTESNGYDEVIITYTYYFTVNSGSENGVDYVYHYEDGTTETVKWVCNDKEVAFTVDFVVYENKDTASKGAKLENVYFCYYPAYNDANLTSYPYVSDNITIENNILGDEIAVHIIKQKNPAYADTDLITLEGKYEPNLNGTGSGGKVLLYHNFYENLGDITQLTKLDTEHGTDVNKGIIEDLMLRTGNEYSDADTTPTMYGKDADNLMYAVEVYIYPANSYDASVRSIKPNVDPVIRLASTMLDW